MNITSTKPFGQPASLSADTSSMLSLRSPAWQLSRFIIPAGCGLLAAIAVAYEWWPVIAILVTVAMTALAPIEFAFGILALAVPFDTVGQIAGHETPSFLISAGSGVILLATAVTGLRFQMMRKTALFFLLFFLWTAISTFWALNMDLSMERLPAVIAIGALYLVAVTMRFSDREFIWIRRMTVIGGGIASAVSLYQFVHGVTVSSRATIIIGSNSTNPNELATSLLLPVSFAIGGIISSHGTKRVLTSIVAGLILACIILTMSRGALIALVAMAVVYVWRKGLDWRLITLFVCMAGFVLFASNLALTRVEEAISSRAQGRIDVWLVGIQIVQHYGLFGVGLDNFSYAFERFAGYQVIFRTYEQDPHNIYLQAIAETGVIGILLLIGALSSQMAELRKALKGVSQRTKEMLVPCEAAAWALMVHALAANLLWRKIFWFDWIVVAVAVQVAQHSTQHHSVMNQIPCQYPESRVGWNG